MTHRLPSARCAPRPARSRSRRSSSFTSPPPSRAQAAARDSARADSTRAQRLERVMISAVRASGAAPISAEDDRVGRDRAAILRAGRPAAAPGRGAVAHGVRRDRQLLGLQLHPAARHRSVAHQPHDRRHSAQRPRRSGALLRRLPRSREQPAARCRCSAASARAATARRRTPGRSTWRRFRSRRHATRATCSSRAARSDRKRASAEFSSGLLPSRFAMVRARVGDCRPTAIATTRASKGGRCSFAAATSAIATSLKLTDHDGHDARHDGVPRRRRK